MENNVVLTMRDISKTFPGVKALQHVDFTLRKGEIHALMGENGAGKSTLIKVLTGVHPFESGEIKMEGKDAPIVNRSPQDAQDNGISTVYQEVNLCPNLTVAENLFIGREPRKAGLIDWKTMNKKSTELLKDLQIDAKATDKLEECSLAKQQMIAIARAVDMNCRVLILDEPTNHLDIQSKEILESAMNAYTGTILYVSHDRYFINKTATRILEISDHGLTSYPGNYQDYIAQKEKEKASLTSSTASSVSVDTESKLDWKQQKEEQAKQRKKENRLKKVEEQITELETKQEELSEAMSLPENASDPAKLMELSNEQASIASSLEELYEEWETLC